MNFNKMSLKKKVFLLISMPMLTLLICSAVSFYQLQNLQSEVRSVKEYGDVLLNFERIRVESNAIPRHIWAALNKFDKLEERQESFHRAEESFVEVKKHLDLARQHKEDYQDILVGKTSPFVLVEGIESAYVDFEAMYKEVKALMLKHTEADQELARSIVMSRQAKIADLIAKSVEQSIEDIHTSEENLIKSVEATNKLELTLLVLFISISSLICLGVSYVVTNKLSRGVLDIINSVASTSQHVNSASSQISNASQLLASASQTQASSIEETSAALAEMAGMVEKNTQNAETTAKLAERVKSHSEKSVGNAVELFKSMNEIMESNRKIEQLVKVIEEIGEKTSIIDEIVFQTKLLSFNASVEAERAGEHGRGFAVVAQEVGNLAQMSGKAALEISSIVKSSVKEAMQISAENKVKVETGYKIVEEIEKVLKTVESSANEVLDLSGQVLEASKEQNTGISQINISVDSINKTTQETAATAEETASSAEELNSQSESLQSMVKKLSEVVTGDAVVDHKPDSVTSNVLKFVDKKSSQMRATDSNFSIPSTTAAAAWEKL